MLLQSVLFTYMYSEIKLYIAWSYITTAYVCCSWKQDVWYLTKYLLDYYLWPGLPDLVHVGFSIEMILTHFKVACGQCWTCKKSWKNHVYWNNHASTHIPISNLNVLDFSGWKKYIREMKTGLGQSFDHKVCLVQYSEKLQYTFSFKLHKMYKHPH